MRCFVPIAVLLLALPARADESLREAAGVGNEALRRATIIRGLELPAGLAIEAGEEPHTVVVTLDSRTRRVEVGDRSDEEVTRLLAVVILELVDSATLPEAPSPAQPVPDEPLPRDSRGVAKARPGRIASVEPLASTAVPTAVSLVSERVAPGRHENPTAELGVHAMLDFGLNEWGGRMQGATAVARRWSITGQLGLATAPHGGSTRFTRWSAGSGIQYSRAFGHVSVSAGAHVLARHQILELTTAELRKSNRQFHLGAGVIGRVAIPTTAPVAVLVTLGLDAFAMREHYTLDGADLASTSFLSPWASVGLAWFWSPS